jgi:transglutaminase-like putative cysteine protease
MKRVALGVIFGAAAASFAATLSSLPAWLFVAAALASMFWRGFPTFLPARRFLYLALGATVLYGWILMVYPVVSSQTMRAWSLAMGYCVGGLGSLFLLSQSSPWRTSIPAAAALLVISSFDLNASIHSYLAVVWLAVIVYLVADSMPLSSGRTALLAGAELFAFSVGALVVLTLPWMQGVVEEAMVSVYTPASDGVQAQYRSRLGELESLKRSKKIVMRVWSERPQRLRSRVLVHFDGTAWVRDPAETRSLEPRPAERLDTDARTFLDGITGVDFVTGEGALLGQRLIQTKVVRVDGEGLVTPGGSLVVRAPLEGLQIDTAGVVSLTPRTRVRVYGILHEVDHQRSQRGPATEAVLEATRQLPDGLDPRLRALSDKLASGAASDEELAERVVTYLRKNYHYSLDIGKVDPRNPLADFLFEKKEGWCEYFASSAAVLLRAQGIPTRYVRGFNVIGSQKKGDHYVVRDWDRHAWIEVYVEGKGWLEYDPTPPAEYESRHATLEEGVLSDAIEWVRMELASFYASLRHFDYESLVEPALVLVVLFVVFRLLYPLIRARPWQWRHNRGGDTLDAVSELDALVEVIDRALVEMGCPRPASRAPLEHWSTLPEDRISPELRDAGFGVLRDYYGIRFGARKPSNEELQALRKRAASMSSHA